MSEYVLCQAIGEERRITEDISLFSVNTSEVDGPTDGTERRAAQPAWLKKTNSLVLWFKRPGKDTLMVITLTVFLIFIEAPLHYSLLDLICSLFLSGSLTSWPDERSGHVLGWSKQDFNNFAGCTLLAYWHLPPDTLCYSVLFYNAGLHYDISSYTITNVSHYTYYGSMFSFIIFYRKTGDMI